MFLLEASMRDSLVKALDIFVRDSLPSLLLLDWFDSLEYSSSVNIALELLKLLTLYDSELTTYSRFDERPKEEKPLRGLSSLHQEFLEEVLFSFAT